MGSYCLGIRKQWNALVEWPPNNSFAMPKTTFFELGVCCNYSADSIWSDIRSHNLHVFLSSSWEVFYHQGNLRWVVKAFILLTCTSDHVLINQGEIRCLSLLRLPAEFTAVYRPGVFKHDSPASVRLCWFAHDKKMVKNIVKFLFLLIVSITNARLR